MSALPALLLIDMQRDFLARNGIIPAVPDLIANVAELLQQVRARGWPVCHIQTRVSADGSDWMPHWRRAGRADCIEGTQGAEPPPQLQPLPGEAVFAKRFFGAFDQPALAAALRRSAVDTVIVSGVHTHACVREAAVGAYAAGFDVMIAREAVGSYDPAHAEHTLGWLEGRVAQCLPTAALLAELDRRAGAG